MEGMMRTILILVVIVLCILGTASALAQPNAAYDLTWSSSSASAGLATGGAYSLITNVAQPEAGNTQAGGEYSLNGGIVDAGESGGSAPEEQSVFLPLIRR